MNDRVRAIFLSTALLGAVSTGVIVSSRPVLAVHQSAVLRGVGVGKGPNAIAVDVPAHRAYVVNSVDDTVSVLDARSGFVLRTVRLGAARIGQDAVAAAAVDVRVGRVFIVLPKTPPAVSNIAVLEAVSGRLVGVTPLGELASRVGVDEATSRVFVTNLDSNTVSVLSGHTGALLRTVRTGQGPSGIAVDDRANRVYVANSDGTISVLDAGTGVRLHTLATRERRTGFAEIALGQSGHIFVFYQNGHASVLEASTGRLIRTVVIGTFPGGMALDARTGHLFVTYSGPNFNGHRVGMLDARSGTVIRTVSVDRGPLGTVADTGTGRVFVANYGGNSVSILDSRTGNVLHTFHVSWPFAMAQDDKLHHVFVVGYSGKSHGSVAMLDGR